MPTGMAGSISVLTAFAHDRNTLYRNLGNATFEDASLQAGLATITFQRMGWGIAFLDADLDGQLDLFIANGHIFADVGDYPELGETFAQRNQFLLNVGERSAMSPLPPGRGCRWRRSVAALAVGDLDNDGDPDVVISNMDDTPTLLENRQRTGHHWVDVQVRAGPRTISALARASPSKAAPPIRFARSDPVAVTSRRTTSSRTTVSARIAVRSTSRSRCPVAPSHDGAASPRIAC